MTEDSAEVEVDPAVDVALTLALGPEREAEEAAEGTMFATGKYDTRRINATEGLDKLIRSPSQLREAASSEEEQN